MICIGWNLKTDIIFSSMKIIINKNGINQEDNSDCWSCCCCCCCAQMFLRSEIVSCWRPRRDVAMVKYIVRSPNLFIAQLSSLWDNSFLSQFVICCGKRATNSSLNSWYDWIIFNRNGVQKLYAKYGEILHCSNHIRLTENVFNGN